jgi:hypothetical protein
LRLSNAVLIISPMIFLSLLSGCGGGGGNGIPSANAGPLAQNVGISMSSGADSVVPTAQKAASADAFVDSIGVNTHFTFTDQVYYTNYPTVKSLLIASGIRHMRDGLFTPTSFYPQRLNELAAAGVKSILFTSPDDSDADVRSFAASVAGSVEAYEGPNELDNTTGTFASSLLSYVPHVVQLLHSTPSAAELPFIAPSFASYNSFSVVRGISSYINYGNMHNYYGGYNPGTTGWGDPGIGGNYASMSYAVAHAKLVSGSAPIISTETGYCDGNAPNASPVPQAIAVRYMPRLLLAQFQAGITRTYIFELADEPGTGTFTTCGLLTSGAVAKPQYSAVKNLITMMSDKGSDFTPGSLSYGISGQTADTRQVLLEKRDGTFYLVLWQEVQGSTPGSNTVASITPQNIHIAFNASHTVTRYALTDQGSIPAQGVAQTTNALDFPVDDHVTILQIR